MKKPYQYPNEKVQEWVRPYWSGGSGVNVGNYPYSGIEPLHRAIEDVLVGVSWLDATDFNNQPKVKPNLVLAILANLEVISTPRVAEALPDRYSESTIKRYCKAASIASRALLSYMERYPKEVEIESQGVNS